MARPGQRVARHRHAGLGAHRAGSVAFRATRSALSARVGSISDNRLGGWHAYRASKAGVRLLTETIAEENLGTVRANAVMPSVIDTPMNREMMPDADHSTWVEPEEIARVIAFLCSDAADFITGQSFYIDGGQSLWGDQWPIPPDIPAEPPGEDADLPIDEDGFDDRDLAALEGCWNLASDYRITNPDTREASGTESWQMCFDDGGRGTQTLEFENGVRCEGRVQAQFEPDGSLRIIDLGNVPCDNGLAIVQRVIECARQPDGSVDCTTQHVTPPAFPVPVRFER